MWAIGNLRAGPERARVYFPKSPFTPHYLERRTSRARRQRARRLSLEGSAKVINMSMRRSVPVREKSVRSDRESHMVNCDYRGAKASGNE